MTQFKQNNTSERVTYKPVSENGFAINLTGATAQFVMIQKEQTYINAPAAVDEANSQLVYEFTAQDTLYSGVYTGEFRVTFADGTIKHYPEKSYLRVQIDKVLDPTESTVSEDNIAYRVSQFEDFKTQSATDASGKVWGSLQERLNNTDAQLADTANKPRLSLSFLAARTGLNNSDNYAGSDYVALGAFSHSYDTKFGNTSVLWVLEKPMAGRTAQRVLRSSDGGNSWTTVKTLTISFDTGVYYVDIYFDPISQYVLLLKQTAGGTYPTHQMELMSSSLNTTFATQDIGSHTWLSSTHSVASAQVDGVNVIMVSEYIVSPNNPNTDCNVWKWQSNNPSVWTKVMTQQVNDDGTGIRHFHSIQLDPYTGYWWVAAGDSNNQSKIFKSNIKNPSLTSDWTIMHRGSQNARTCSLHFEPEHIYWGSDAIDAHIFKATKDFSSITTIGRQTDGQHIYMLCRTLMPAGYLIFSRHEPVSPTNSDRTVIQFYSLKDEKLYDVAEISHMGTPKENYFGFIFASRFQDTLTGEIYAFVDNDWRIKYSYVNNVATIGNILRIKISI